MTTEINEYDNVTVAALLTLEDIVSRGNVRWATPQEQADNRGPVARLRRENAALVAEIERLTGEPTEDEIGRAGDVLAAHGYRVTSDWYPFCDCGWRADQMYDVAAFDRHIARAALRAARGLSF